MILSPWAQRRMEAERLDDTALDEGVHQEAMQGLVRINAWSDAVNSLWRRLRPIVLHTGLKRLRVLDVATGAGDVPVGLWKSARDEGVALDFDLCDRHPLALKYAAKLAREAGFTPRLITLDVVGKALPTGYHLALSSLFLHHLTDEQASGVLRQMARAAPALAVMDLRRGLAGVTLARFGAPLLTRSGVLYADALKSYRAAFTISEARRLAGEAGLNGARVTPAPGRRWVMTWRTR